MSTQWQPIETAPTDGTRVVGWCPCNTSWGPSKARVVWNNGKRWLSEPGYWESPPTHWMPLPDPPSGKGQAA